MTQVWILSLASVFLVSLISLSGAWFLMLRRDRLDKILMYLVSFAAGGLLGNAFLNLLPGAVARSGFGLKVSLMTLGGMTTSFVAEQFIEWRHCHIPTSEDHPHRFAYMNLWGDAVHNLIDGLVIAAAFMADIRLGFATTLAVMFHEIPQEVGAFGVLVAGGFSPKKALWINFMTALTSVAGAVIALLVFTAQDAVVSYLLPFAAGNFIYIASADLIPELHHHVSLRDSYVKLFTFLAGIAMMVALSLFHTH